MKTRKHGKGLTHKQVVKFSNRLAYAGLRLIPSHNNDTDFDIGWKEACKYFAHELRVTLRYYEKLNEI